MASITFNNCTVNIKQQVNEGGKGNYYDYGTSSTTNLPTVLSTPTALELWKKAQNAGWIDANFQPTISNTKASLLADYIGKKLNLTERWKPFSDLWHIEALYKVYDKAISSPSTSEFIDLIINTMNKQ